MKLLVTGGAGFIGSAFVRLVAGQKFDIAVVDKLSYAGDLERIKSVSSQIRFHEIDLLDSASLEEVFKAESPEAVVHFAAETHVDRSILHPKQFIESNVMGMFNLLESSVKHSVKRFVQISTDEVYGELPADKKLKFKEGDPPLPNSPYSATKVSADMLARAYQKTYSLPVVTVRPSNNYGPWQYPEKLIPLLIAKAILDEKMPVYGKGENVRTWLFVEDCAQAILKVLEAGRVGREYNVGSDEEKRNIEVIRSILKLLGKGDDLIEFVPDRPAHDFRYAVETNRIKTELGWSPKTSFESGLEKTVNWYRQNEKWLMEKKRAVESFVQELRENFAKMSAKKPRA